MTTKKLHSTCICIVFTFCAPNIRVYLAINSNQETLLLKLITIQVISNFPLPQPQPSNHSTRREPFFQGKCYLSYFCMNTFFSTVAYVQLKNMIIIGTWTNDTIHNLDTCLIWDCDNFINPYSVLPYHYHRSR